MNVPDLRNVDFDAYRDQAAELRRQAIDDTINRLVDRVKSLLGSRPSVAVDRCAAPTAPCGA